MDRDAVEHYRRLLNAAPYLEESLCLTFARGLDRSGLIRAFGGDPAATMPGRELQDLLDKYHYSQVPSSLLVAEIGPWQLGYEVNGYQGSRPEVLRRAAADGEAVSVYWNVNAHSALRYAAYGRNRFGFDMLFPEDSYGPDKDELDARLAGLPFGIDDGADWQAAGLAMAERITGVRLPADFVNWEMRGVVLEEVPEDLVPEGSEHHVALQQSFIQETLAAPTIDRVPAIAVYLARLIAEDSGITDQPAVTQVLEALASGSSPRPELRADLSELGESYFRQSRAKPGPDSVVPFSRGHAVRDFIATAFPGRSLLDRVTAGSYGFQDPDRSLQAHVLRRCADRALRDAKKDS